LARLLASNALDRRTGIARDFHGAQDALVADRGGWEHTTTAEKMLVELAAMELLIVRSIFIWAARQPSFVTDTPDGPRLLGPLQKGFTSHAGTLARTLVALGLRPDKVDRLPSLQEYLAQREQDHAVVAPAQPEHAAVAGPVPAQAPVGAHAVAGPETRDGGNSDG
jgi:hypothetical protein